MPIVEHSAVTSASCVEAFDLSMSVAQRFTWDPLIKGQRFLDGATCPGVGVTTETWSRHRLTMVTRYLTFRRPTHIGMKMLKGPWFFRTFSGAWRFEELPSGGCRVWFRYDFSCRPAVLGLRALPDEVVALEASAAAATRSRRKPHGEHAGEMP